MWHARGVATPWVLASPTIVGTLQIGNAQLLFIAIAAAAMLLFERGRHATGGALLAYAVVSKLFPGLLVLYLLLRRDWRAVGWTAAWGLAILVVAVADVGLAPFTAFVDQLPRLLSGEAFPAFRNAGAIAINESVPGLVFKIREWGGPAFGFGAARVVGWIYTLFLIAATAWLALRPAPRSPAPLIWISLLILATMRSPFLPYYAPFPSLWLATLIAAVGWQQRSFRWTAIALWVVLAINMGQGFIAPPVQAAWTSVHTIAAFALVALALRASAPPAGTPDRSAVLAGAAA
jgi:alpha-1,2-mannosyltransferase